MRSAKKVGSVSIAKKQKKSPAVSAKKVTSPKRSIKITSRISKKALDTKLEKITALHSKDKKPHAHINELAPSPMFKRSLMVRPTISLAVLSAYRFPLDPQRTAVGVARYGGTLFALVGALCTMYFAAAINSAPASTQVAQLISHTTQAQEQHSNAPSYCNDPLQYHSQACAPFVEKTPAVSFELQGDAQSLSGSIRVRTNVDHAKKVILELVSKERQKSFSLGEGTSVAGNSWEVYVDTTDFLDGAYTLRAIVTNAHGTYEANDTQVLTIHNFPPTLQQSLDGVSETDSSVDSAQLITIREQSMAPSMRSFKVDDARADQVKIYVTQEQQGNEVFVGNAYQVSDTTWQYDWNIEDYAQGTYLVRAQSVDSGLIFYSNTLRIDNNTQGEASVLGVATSSEVTALKSETVFTLPESKTLTDSVDISVQAADAVKIELFAKRTSELSLRYLGTMKKIGDQSWAYAVNTLSLPNGDYTFVSRVTNDYGSYESVSAQVRVSHSEVPFTQEQKDRVAALKGLSLASTSAQSVTSTIAAELSLDATTQDKLDQLMLLLKAASAIGDASAIKTLHTTIESVVLPVLKAASDVDDAAASASEYVAKMQVEAQLYATTLATLLRDRFNETAIADSDADSLSDYDEAVMLGTNPFSADTDSDGFIDSAELHQGYSPTDASSEVLVQYASPHTEGTQREDLLTIDTVARAQGTEQFTSVLFTGSAMPYSYVTLHIFSSPRMATVRADKDGAWIYRLDTELEYGDHEMYAALTDNEGTLIAKSAPFTFTKEGDVYTPAFTGDEKPAIQYAVKSAAPDYAGYMMYLVLSICVVAIGLVLILLGLYLDSRARAAATPTPKSV
jgi:hypothetical protein